MSGLTVALLDNGVAKLAQSSLLECHIVVAFAVNSECVCAYDGGTGTNRRGRQSRRITANEGQCAPTNGAIIGQCKLRTLGLARPFIGSRLTCRTQPHDINSSFGVASNASLPFGIPSPLLLGTVSCPCRSLQSCIDSGRVRVDNESIVKVQWRPQKLAALSVHGVKASNPLLVFILLLSNY